MWRKLEKWLWSHLVALIVIATVSSLVAVLGTYIWNFRGQSLSPDIADWAHFGTYVGGLLGPAFAFIAIAAALLGLFESRGVARFDRELVMLQRALASREEENVKGEPITQAEAHQMLVRTISDVVPDDDWGQVYEAFASNQYILAKWDEGKLFKALEQGIAIVFSETSPAQRQNLLDWMLFDLQDHEYYLLASYFMTNPANRCSMQAKELELFAEWRFHSDSITTRLTQVGFKLPKPQS